MPRQPAPQAKPDRRMQYVRLIIASAAAAIVLGFYLHLTGRIQMTGLRILEFVVRGAIIGALIWGIELFYFLGRGRVRIARLDRGARIGVRVVAYLVLFELGFQIGGLLFHPVETARFLHLTAG